MIAAELRLLWPMFAWCSRSFWVSQAVSPAKTERAGARGQGRMVSQRFRRQIDEYEKWEKLAEE